MIPLFEILLIWLSFALLAGQFPPGVNESHYLTKAKHFWNPQWCPDDIFLASSFAHWLFYVCFGWITCFCSLTTFAWIGRALTWLLMAIAWQRLAWRVAPLPFVGTLSAILFFLLNDRFHLAGEWVVGGFEAKGIAYFLVMLAMGQMLSDRWKFVWPLLGVAGAFHVLVGGWAGLAAGFCWLATRLTVVQPGLPKNQLQRLISSLRTQSRPMLLGLALLTVGAIPPLLTGRTASAEATQIANDIYVNQRISHHLVFGAFPTAHVARFALLVLLWALLFRWVGFNRMPKVAPDGTSEESSQALRNLFYFGLGSLFISLGGLLLSGLADANQQFQLFTSSLLKFYWFRLSDFAIPATTALCVATVIDRWVRIEKQTSRRICVGIFSIAIVAAAGLLTIEKNQDPRPVADRRGLTSYSGDTVRTQQTYENWLKVCRWINQHTPEDAVFITPHKQQTFKWYAGRTEVVNWKDVPQDADSMRQWNERVKQLLDPQKQYELGLMAYSDQQLEEIAQRFAANYLVIPQRQVDLSPTPTDLKQVYPVNPTEKSTFVVFALGE